MSSYSSTDQSRPIPSNHCCVGDFVALRMVKYEDEIPQVGKVVEVGYIYIYVGGQKVIVRQESVGRKKKRTSNRDYPKNCSNTQGRFE